VIICFRDGGFENGGTCLKDGSTDWIIFLPKMRTLKREEGREKGLRTHLCTISSFPIIAGS